MSRIISGAQLRRSTARFARDWKDEPGSEKQQAQSFVRDLLAAYGVTETKAAQYEKRAKRTSTGRQGYIDALIPGVCVIEMKSAGENLVSAERQALDYLDDLSDAEDVRYVITSDFKTFRVLDLFAPEDDATTTFSLAELPANYDTLGFLAGHKQRSFGTREQERASVKAARVMASLYEELEASGYPDHDASIFLVRILFCLYADDADVWDERDLFQQFIEAQTREDGSDLGAQLAWLFQVLNQDKRMSNLPAAVAQFPYVNGGVFGETIQTPVLTAKMRTKLLDACGFNWAAISPAIFGSLFQAVKNKAARRELGEHYTTETNILKTINPLFMDELRDKFIKAKDRPGELKKLRAELAAIRVLDPACGCGNFLIVAYRELRKLDLDILVRLRDLGALKGDSGAMFFTDDLVPVSLDHVAGIELEEWPARIAATALHLVHHQANLAMEQQLGAAPDPLPLNKVESIHDGNALRLDWRDVMPPSPGVRIVGNPPFIGARRKDAEQKEDLALAWGKPMNDHDYVSGWFKKAADYFANTQGGRFAFVSTNSIAQGQPVPELFKPLSEAGWRIRFAHQTFAWTSEAPDAAAVHCVITGFDKCEKSTPTLFGYQTLRGEPTAVPVKQINAYLVDGPDVFVTKRPKPLSPSLPPAQFGSMPNDGGNLIVEAADYETVLLDPIAAKYVRPFRGARELIQDLDRWCLWLEEAPPSDLGKSTVLKGRVEACRAFRAGSKREATRRLAETPALFAERRQPSVPYLIIPRVSSEHRSYLPTRRVNEDVVASDGVFTCPDPDGFAFGVVSSSMLQTWLATIGGKLKSDYRFSNTVVWNTLPLPQVTDKVLSEIIEAGKGVQAARDLHPEWSLADHYSPLGMTPELLKAHRALDRVVDKAFGARKSMHTMEDRQAVLFQRYAEMTV